MHGRILIVQMADLATITTRLVQKLKIRVLQVFRRCQKERKAVALTGGGADTDAEGVGDC